MTTTGPLQLGGQSSTTASSGITGGLQLGVPRSTATAVSGVGLTSGKV